MVGRLCPGTNRESSTNSNRAQSVMRSISSGAVLWDLERWRQNAHWAGHEPLKTCGTSAQLFLANSMKFIENSSAYAFVRELEERMVEAIYVSNDLKPLERIDNGYSTQSVTYEIFG